MIFLYKKYVWILLGRIRIPFFLEDRNRIRINSTQIRNPTTNNLSVIVGYVHDFKFRKRPTHSFPYWVSRKSVYIFWTLAAKNWFTSKLA